MEDPRWLRLITIGLVLSALAVGYFLLTGKFTSTKISKSSPTPQATQQAKVNQASPSPSPSASGLSAGLGRQSTPSASGQAKGGTNASSLPNTGFPIILTGVFSLSAIAAGFGLRKYPN